MPEAETRTDIEKGKAGGRAQFWLQELQRAGKRERKWRKEGQEVIERYRNERKRTRGLNILWANTEILKPAVLSRTPQPDVRQRFLVHEPVAKAAADILEKALKFCADDPDYGFVEQLEAARDDMLLPGRGLVRVLYDSAIERETMAPDESGAYASAPDGTDDEGNAYRERVSKQQVYCKHIYWEDYREGDARCWEDVPWLAYRHTMTRAELVKQFGKIGQNVKLTLTTKEEEGESSKQDDPEHPLKRAVVWEIWDKDGGRKRCWVAESHNEELLDEEDDPYKLEGFFPQPDPLYGVRTTDTRLPVPEFRIYRDQADELDDISLRIKRLIDACKVRGVYAAVAKEMADLLNGDENELFPVEDWAALRERGGLEGAIAWLPIEQIAKVLISLYQQRDLLKAEIYELTGISDLLRGNTDATETATAQRIKGNFGQMRLTPRQQPMERFVRQIFRIKAEIIAEHFTPEHLTLIAGEPVPPEVLQLLRTQKLRDFTIDVETDTTVQPDEQAEKQNVVEFMTASTKFLNEAAAVGAAAPVLSPMLFEMFKAGARRFKMGRELEDVIEETAQQMEQQMAQAAQQPPQPSPEEMKAQADMQMAQAKGQLDMQKGQMEMQFAREKHQLDVSRMQQEMQMKTQAQAQEVEHKGRMAETDERNAVRKMRFEAAAKGPGLDADEEGNVVLHPELKGGLDALAQQIQMLAAQQQQMMALMAAPREAELVRNGQGRAVKAVSRVVMPERPMMQ